MAKTKNGGTYRGARESSGIEDSACREEENISDVPARVPASSDTPEAEAEKISSDHYNGQPSNQVKLVVKLIENCMSVKQV